MTFSLKTLLLIVSAFALVMGFCAACGLEATAGVFLFLISAFTIAITLLILCLAPLAPLYLGVSAFKTGKEIPFLKSLSASVLLLLMYLQPTRDFGPYREWIVVLSSIALGTGAYLAYSSARDGHWTTRILSIPVTVVYSILFIYICRAGINNLSGIVEFWTTVF